MADISTDIPRLRAPTTAFQLIGFQLLLLSILACGCWAAVDGFAAKDRCQTTLGRLAVQLKLDSYYSGCRCMHPSLDFRDPCNGVAVGVI